MSDDNGTPPPEAPVNAEHLNIKVADNNNEIFFKIKRSTKLEKLMNAFCERSGKNSNSVRFLFEGSRVQPSDTPDMVRIPPPKFLPEGLHWLILTLSRVARDAGWRPARRSSGAGRRRPLDG
jgi:hypothetical protein